MKSVSLFSRGTVLNKLKQSRINIMRGTKGATTFPNRNRLVGKCSCARCSSHNIYIYIYMQLNSVPYLKV